MTTETFFQLHYHLTDTEGLFDLAQGLSLIHISEPTRP